MLLLESCGLWVAVVSEVGVSEVGGVAYVPKLP